MILLHHFFLCLLPFLLQFTLQLPALSGKLVDHRLTLFAALAGDHNGLNFSAFTELLLESIENGQ